MNTIKVVAILSLCRLVALAADVSPQTSQTEVKVAEIQARLEADARQLSENLQKRIASIRPPEKPDNAGEAAIGIDFEFEWEIQTIKLHLPEITLRQQEMFLHLPTTTLRQKEMFFDKPVIRMERRKTGEYPQVTVRWEVRNIGLGVKTKVPVTETTMHPMYADVPITRMERQRIVMGVPEFTMERKRIVMGVPQFAMRLKEIKLHLPKLKSVELKKDNSRYESEVNETTRQFDQAISARQAEATGEVRSVVIKEVSDQFSVVRKDLAAQIDAAKRSFATGLMLIDGSIKALREQGVPDDNADLKAMLESRAQVLAEQDKTLRDFTAQLAETTRLEKDAIEGALRGIDPKSA